MPAELDSKETATQGVTEERSGHWWLSRKALAPPPPSPPVSDAVGQTKERDAAIPALPESSACEYSARRRERERQRPYSGHELRAHRTLFFGTGIHR
jgi:hypothetical protein